MKRGVYYNEFEAYPARWIRNLMKKGLIADGEVDTRSIRDVCADDVRGFVQCHWFAGLAGWPCAVRLAGWADDRECWTGSPPCQPFSLAGKGEGYEDERDLWPAFFRLIRECRPATIFGEQVASAIGHGWLDRMCADLEGKAYAVGSAVLPACAVRAPHRRDRLWIVADALQSDHRGYARNARGSAGPSCGEARPTDGDAIGNPRNARSGGHDDQRPLADALRPGWPERRPVAGPGEVAGDGGPFALADPSGQGRPGWPQIRSGWQVSRAGGDPWGNSVWLAGADGKTRRVGTRVRGLDDGTAARLAGMRADDEEEIIPLLARGVANRVQKLRALGNAIVPPLAAEVIRAYMEARP